MESTEPTFGFVRGTLYRLQKSRVLKGTAFRPYVTNLESVGFSRRGLGFCIRQEMSKAAGSRRHRHTQVQLIFSGREAR